MTDIVIGYIQNCAVCTRYAYKLVATSYYLLNIYTRTL